MENREILIANTKTQKRTKLVTNATTLGELKTAMDNAEIDYDGMTFTEGISKIQLLDDNSPLPQNVMYKGQETNNLVILLTNTKKNIASGAGSRAEAYASINANNLQEAVKEEFGRNFTQVRTDLLWQFIDNSLSCHSVDCSCGTGIPDAGPEKPSEEVTETTCDHIIALIDNLYQQNVLSCCDLNTIKTHLDTWLADNEEESSEPVSTSDGNITDDDIDDMINDINGIN